MRWLRTMVRELWRDKSLMRIYLNRALLSQTLRGRTLDIGAGGDSKYLDFMPRTDSTRMEVLEVKKGASIDFERDQLPYADGSFDTVVLLNVLEHVYNYGHLAGEARRILAPGGQLIGYTPFLVRYHPDPHDFFRYTDEALLEILTTAGFSGVTITPVGAGPFLAALNVFIISIPRPVRVIVAPLALFLDKLFIRMRPHAPAIYAMGYCFTASRT